MVKVSDRLRVGKPRRRTVLLGAVAAAAVVAAGVLAYVSGHHDGSPEAQNGAAISTPLPSGAAASGCLGGSAITDEMLLTTQRRAPHDEVGAVELAASFFRWSYRFPTPDPADVAHVSSVFVPGQESAAVTALAAIFKRTPNQAAGIVANGTAFSVSTAEGVWNTQPGQQQQDVLVDIRARFVVDGSLSGTRTISESFNMRWRQGAWRVTFIGPVDTRQLFGAAEFTRGC